LQTTGSRVPAPAKERKSFIPCSIFCNLHHATHIRSLSGMATLGRLSWHECLSLHFASRTSATLVLCIHLGAKPLGLKPEPRWVLLLRSRASCTASSSASIHSAASPPGLGC
jgi:hypothetical protein